MEKVSFIATVYNEGKSINRFLDSILTQSHKPDEVVIVDAGSTDGTVAMLQSAEVRFRKAGIPHFIIVEPGNRSHGRNTAINLARYELIAVSDAGCILDKDWLKNLLAARTTEADVVSGYYSPANGKPTPFQKALAAYTCTMPDKLDPATFLPSSRSVLFTRKAWKSVGGYPEHLDTCEDLMFARSLKNSGKRFVMAQNAIVYWPQKNTFSEAAQQLFGYAFGDGQAGYVRRTILYLFARYIAAALLLWLDMRFMLLLIPYLAWAIWKNYRYVGSWHAVYLLPALQLIADGAVMSGMALGYLSRVNMKKI